jgi:hypothetical protein
VAMEKSHDESHGPPARYGVHGPLETIQSDAKERRVADNHVKLGERGDFGRVNVVDVKITKAWQVCEPIVNVEQSRLCSSQRKHPERIVDDRHQHT